jgi:hypothetical protein
MLSNERAATTGNRLSVEAVDRRDMFGIFPGVDPANREVYEPLPGSLLPKEGSWIMIRRRLPNIEGGIDKIARVGRIFWGEHLEEADDEGFLMNGSYKIQAYLPEKLGFLWPYEYSTIAFDKVLDVWQREEIIFHPMNLELARFNDIVFYCRTRGISKADAVVMALGTVNGPIGWFEPRPDIAEECEALEARVNRWEPKERKKKR